MLLYHMSAIRLRLKITVLPVITNDLNVDICGGCGCPTSATCKAYTGLEPVAYVSDIVVTALMSF